jgi:hypothetical protein
MYRYKIFLALLVVPAGIVFSQTEQQAKNKGLQNIKAEEMAADLEFLSTDILEGREAGKKGAELAAYYIASQFKKCGLIPLNEDHRIPSSLTNYFQPVDLVWETVDETGITISAKNKSIILNEGVDFAHKRVDHSFVISGKLFFGGFGLNEAPDVTFPKNTENKILIRAAGYPAAKDSLSEGFKKYNELSTSELERLKEEKAKEAGVIAILEFDPENPFPFKEKRESAAYAEKELTKYSSGIYKRVVRRANTVSSEKIPVFTISHRTLFYFFPELENKQKDIISGSTPNITGKGTQPTIQMSATIHSEPFESSNIVGKIEGKNKDEFIVIGAHYDHLGFYDGYIWNGADDNTSGIAGVLALAKAFSESGITPEHTMIFAAWTAEERGLHGSTHFVKTFKNPSRIKLYHNYDMIGRSPDPEISDSSVSLIYTSKLDAAEALSKQHNKSYRLGLNIRYAPVENPTGGSDNAPFAQEDIPIIWFHTGGHPDYHGPFDHFDKIDWSKLEKIVRLSYLNLWEISAPATQTGR